ncbi:hypothetical protein [Paenibacillus radicibacter]|uniref:hypothetical protein n=1 Tax=Paenibacillus radicibacter TaxID=2972488 RepID=UPI002159822C|nr:hypothetical protein [Paenibacillus radicibacter]
MSILILAGCKRDIVANQIEIDQIKIEIVKSSITPDGKLYTFKLINESKLTIIQNNVYLSYPIKTASGTKVNGFKIELQNNKLNVVPNEVVLLTAFAPKEMYEGNKHINSDHLYIEMNGYINEVKEGLQFSKSESISVKLD